MVSGRDEGGVDRSGPEGPPILMEVVEVNKEVVIFNYSESKISFPLVWFSVR